jgi:hypothetical protein
MTTAELEAEADRVAALRADPRTPGIVRRAFVRPGALTLRRFLALEEAASPVLDGQWPTGDAAAMADAFCTAWGIVFPGREIPPAADLGTAIAELAAEVTRAFSTVMPMRFPRTPGAPARSEPPDGLGWVARLWARLVSAGLTDPLDTPLDQLFILAAALSANEGADCAGEDYRERVSSDSVRERTLPACGTSGIPAGCQKEKIARQDAAQSTQDACAPAENPPPPAIPTHQQPSAGSEPKSEPEPEKGWPKNDRQTEEK